MRKLRTFSRKPLEVPPLLPALLLATFESYWRPSSRSVVLSLTGLAYLHSRTPPIVHRDIKVSLSLMCVCAMTSAQCANLLVDSQGIIKVGKYLFLCLCVWPLMVVADFGISAKLEKTFGRATQIGSPFWMRSLFACCNFCYEL
jgi:serine/threonine protein kinase